MHLQVCTCMLIMHIITSGGAGTTAGWKAGVEHLGPAENLEAAIERILGPIPAAEGLGRTGGLAAAAAYELR